MQKVKSRDLPPTATQSLGTLADSINQLGARLEEMEAEHKKLIALAEIGSVVNSSLELDEVLRIVMDNIVRLTGAERGFLMLRDASGEMVTQVARHWSQESIKSGEAATSRTIVQRVIETGEAIVTTNAQDDQRFSSTASVVALNLRSILCVPLKVKNDLIGVIYTDNRIRTGIFSEGDRDLLAAFRESGGRSHRERQAVHLPAAHTGRGHGAEGPDGQRLLLDHQRGHHGGYARPDHARESGGRDASWARPAPTCWDIPCMRSWQAYQHKSSRTWPLCARAIRRWWTWRSVMWTRNAAAWTGASMSRR